MKPFLIILSVLIVICGIGYTRRDKMAADRVALENAKLERQLKLQEKQTAELDRLADNKQFAKGMTKAQVERAWGKPSRSTTTETSSYVIETWFYPTGTFYFSAEKLIEWHIES